MNRLSLSAPLLRLALSLSLCLLARPVPAAEPAPFDVKLLDAFEARPLGPANMGGRITDVAVLPGQPSVMYVASASGGLWKTINNGTTWEPVFDHQATVSLGCVAVAPSKPDVVWVGTGEANPRNSVSWGDGVYQSTDGGKTWTNRGLKDSHTISRIVIDPRNPDVVYVAALGHLWGPSQERGLYKTTDGGKTWRRLKFLDEETGFSDLVLDPTAPDTLYAAAYRVRRDAFDGPNPVVQTGPESGLYKTTDGGQTWKKLTAGLPSRPLGRCGLALWSKDPRLLYAVVQTDRTLLQRSTEWGQPAKASDVVDTGGVFRSLDRGETWVKVNDLCPRPFYFSQVRLDPKDAQRLYVLGVTLHVSADGGKTFAEVGASAVHADQHTLWIDPGDPQHLVLGNDGGVYFSYDRGATWEHLKNLVSGQFYAVAVDQRQPFRVYGGLQDNGTWGGPSATHNLEGITLADWKKVLGGDGFSCQVDPTDADTVYAELQYGGLSRVNVRTGASKSITPAPAKGQPAYRFNWNAPVLLSPHDPHTLYFGGDHLFRSTDRGDTWQKISPDLTGGQPGPSRDYGHTLTTVAESPVRAGLLYAGSDDGRVQVTRDGGTHWTDLSDRVPGVPAERWVSRLECSHFAEGTAYLAIDRHRNDDRRPYLFRTTDYGAHWQDLAKGLPADGCVHVIREDPRDKDLLFVGTEFGLFVSLDAGASWNRFQAGLPTVAVRDLVIHPRDHDLVIATHGRSVYVLDVAPLEELTAEVLAADVHLFDVKPAAAFKYHGSLGLGGGGKVYTAPNPPFGAVIRYRFRDAPAQPVRLVIRNVRGETVAVLPGRVVAGLHRAIWNLRPSGETAPGPQPALVASGEYAVTLEVGDRKWTKKFQVEAEE